MNTALGEAPPSSPDTQKKKKQLGKSKRKNQSDTKQVDAMSYGRSKEIKTFHISFER